MIRLKVNNYLITEDFCKDTYLGVLQPVTKKLLVLICLKFLISLRRPYLLAIILKLHDMSRESVNLFKQLNAVC